MNATEGLRPWGCVPLPGAWLAVTVQDFAGVLGRWLPTRVRRGDAPPGAPLFPVTITFGDPEVLRDWPGVSGHAARPGKVVVSRGDAPPRTVVHHGRKLALVVEPHRSLVCLTPLPGLPPSEPGLNHVGRLMSWVLAELLAFWGEGRVTWFHGSAVTVKGGAHVFLGDSGAGKSTLVRRAAEGGLTVLSDDMAPVMWRSREVWPSPEPLVTAGEPVPLAGFHLLSQGEGLKKTPLCGAPRHKTLLRHRWGANVLPAGEGLQMLDVLEAVPCHRLTVPPPDRWTADDLVNCLSS